MHLKLSAEAVELIEAKIASGEFRDAEDVVERALMLLDEPSIEDDEAYLRALIEEGLNSGESVELDPENLKDHLINGAPLRPL